MDWIHSSGVVCGSPAIAGSVKSWSVGLVPAGIALAPCPVSAQSQWQTGTPPGSIYYSGGYVGVGTGTPKSKFHVADSHGLLVLNTNTGVTGNLYYQNGFKYVENGYAGAIKFDATGNISFLTAPNNTGGADAVANISVPMVISMTTGRVGIGTTTPGHLLSVNGTVAAKDVFVTSVVWSDYVFRPGYRLLPLSEVGEYIRAHGRLPDIPSEAEVKEKGVNVGEIQAKLLAKIEELTLHMIRADEENRTLRERVARLEQTPVR